MGKQERQLIRGLHKALDLGVLILAYWLAYFIKKNLLPTAWHGGLTDNHDYLQIMLVALFSWYLMFTMLARYGFHRSSFGAVVRNMVKTVSAAMVVFICCLYLLKIPEVSRLFVGLLWLNSLFLLTVSKGVIYWLIRQRSSGPQNARTILVVGSRRRAAGVITGILENTRQTVRILGCVEIDASQLGERVVGDVKVIATIDELDKILKDHVVDEIVFGMPLRKIPDADRYINLAEDMGVSVRIIPDWQLHYLMYRPGAAKITFEDFHGIPTLALHTTPPNGAMLFLKNVFDFLATLAGLLVIWPLMALIGLAIKIASPTGPILFRQERCGLNGRRFQVYKFRTMAADAEARLSELKALNEADGPAFKLKNDPRVIPVIGTLLRKTSLDELPQLFNVLRGEMSLVGPRPPIPGEVNEYDTWHRRRLSMKPGMTCIWQTMPGRNDVKFDEWMRLDLSYIDRWSLWLDLKILLRTCKVLLWAEGR